MVTNIEHRLVSDLAIPPGELLEEELTTIGMTQQELARRMGRPAQMINEILRGKKQITHDTALELERVLGTPAHFWVNLEAQYQLAKARQRETEELNEQVGWLARFPVRIMEQYGWIGSSSPNTATVRELLRFFGVASFRVWQEQFNSWQEHTVVGFRITPAARVSTGALAAWVRRGEIEGNAADTAPYSEAQFQTVLLAIRALTIQPVRVFVPRMQELCASAGVALVFIPELPKSGVSGYARWLTKDKALIALSLRYKTDDHLWFSFFHECCHILKHQVRQVFVEGLNTDVSLAAESEADQFARDILIPPEEWTNFIQTRPPTSAGIMAFARRVNIAPGIIVGRLQREGHCLPNQFNSLKVRLQWSIPQSK